MDNIFDRTISLIGEENFKKLSSKTILIAGLGGVGGTALECLARSGINKFILVDFDVVSPSNLNRQILYDEADLGTNKVDAAQNRIKHINKNCLSKTFKNKISEDFLNSLDFNKIDFIIDAIDDCNAKVELSRFALKNNIPFIMSLGMANRLNPCKVKIITLDKTSIDPLAKKMRSLIRKANLDCNKINVVYSEEEPIKNDNHISSMMTVPSSAGLSIAYYVIQHILKENITL